MTANALSPKSKPVVVVQSPSDIISHGPGGIMGRNWLAFTVGKGNFTVDSDREQVGAVLSELVDTRAAMGLADGTDKGCIIGRALKAIKRHLLIGLGSAAERVPHAKDAHEFMAEIGFKGVHDGENTGWTPLRLAVMTGRHDLVTQLLDLGADIEAPCTATMHMLASAKGMTILHIASYIRDDPQMVTLLLSRGANPRLRAGKANLTALHYACTYGHVKNIDALMAHDPGLNQLPTISPVAAMLPFTLTANLGNVTALKHVTTAYPQLCPKPGEPGPVGKGMAVTWCTTAVNGIGDVDCLRYLLDQGFVHGQQGGKQTHSAMLFKIADLAVRLKAHPKSLLSFLALSNRCTTLHAAALWGNVGAVKLLLERKADVHSTNHSHGVTPLHLAAYNDHQSIVQLLISAGADRNVGDRRRRTAADWAKRRGHLELASMLKG